MADMADNEDRNAEITSRVESVMLNCGATPKLSDLELNVISDEVNYICDDLLFADVMKDKNRAYRLILDNDIQHIKEYRNNTATYSPNWKLNNLQKERFREIGVNDKDAQTAIKNVTSKMDNFLFPDDPKPKVYDNIIQFEESLDRLGESLEGINDKKETLGRSVKYVIQPSIIAYIIYIIYMFYNYGSTLLDTENGGAVKAELYNIGFASQSTYAALLYRYSQHYEKYCKITYTDGDLDSGVCSAVAGIVTHINIFYNKLMCYKGFTETDTDARKNCKVLMLNSLYEIYEDKYVDNVFMAAKSEFKAAVNSINKFIEKQNKFLLREENFDVNYTADNEAFEYVYRVFLHNAGLKLFKDNRSAKIRRNSVMSKDYTYANTTTTYRIYDTFIKSELLESFINILASPDPIYDSTDPIDVNSKHLRNIIEILSELKKEYLPEYFELVDLIFTVDTKPFFNYSNTKFVEESMINIANLKYEDKHYNYFSEVKDKLILSGTYTMNGADVDDQVTKTTLLTKVQSRKKQILTLQKLYEEFQVKIRTSSLTIDDLKEEGEFFDVFTRIKEDFNIVTEEYKITKTIVMTYMKSYLESDEEFESNPSLRGTAESNIKLLVETILTQLKVSRDIKNNVLNTNDPNLAKYISFMKFENKLNQLDDSDLYRLFQYVKQINTTMRNFRKYVKSEEISFSKRYQIAEIYEKVIYDTYICSGVLLGINFFEMIDQDKRLEKLQNIAESSIGQSARNMKTRVGSTVMNPRKSAKEAVEYVKSKTSAKSKSAPKPALSTGTTFITAEGEPQKQTLGQRFGKLFGRGKKGGDSKSLDDTAQEKNAKKSKSESEKTDKNDDVEEKDKDEVIEKRKDFTEQLTDLIVQIVAAFTAWNVLFQFAFNYLIKYKTDINYDKVTNITNTEIFERELEKYERNFREYIEMKRDTKACKKLYLQLMKTLESYEQCNFVKGSFKRTPFPATEMLTNGILLVICFAVFYVAYTGTGMKDRQENTEKLRALLEKEIEDINDPDVQNRTLKKIKEDLKTEWYKVEKSWRVTYQNKSEEKWNKQAEVRFRGKLKDFLKKFDKKLEKQIKEYQEYKTPDKLVDSQIKVSKRNEIYRQILHAYDKEWHDREEGVGENSQQAAGGSAIKGGNNPQWQNMGQSTPAGPAMSGVNGVNMGIYPNQAQALMMNQQQPYMMERVDLSAEKAMLEQYRRKNDQIQAQLLYMQRDTGYVNWILAGCIFCFGFYFVDQLQQNTRNYKKIMTSGGTYTRECLHD